MERQDAAVLHRHHPGDEHHDHVIGRAQNGGGNEVEYIALNNKTGQVVWSTKIGAATVCAMTSRQLLISVNGQLAILDSATGKQLSYKDDKSGCPRIVGTALTGVGADDDHVLQILNP